MKLSKCLYHYQEIVLIRTVISSACIPYSLCSFEPHRLSHIDFLIKIVMEKGGLHIELVKIQLILCYQWQQNSNWLVLYNRGEYLIVINSFSLWVAFRHQSGFVAYNIFLERSLLLYIYSLTFNCLLPLSNSVSSQVSFLYRELISSSMASFHIFDSELISVPYM